MDHNHRQTRFEFDERKSRINRLKHGIDFVQAQALWLDAELSQTPACSDVEPRLLAVGLVDGKHWSASITYRGDVVRLISARRSSAEEVAIYEGK